MFASLTAPDCVVLPTAEGEGRETYFSPSHFHYQLQEKRDGNKVREQKALTDGAPESVFMAQNKAGAIPKARGEMTPSLLSTFSQTWMYLGQTKMLALITSIPSASSEDQKEAPSSVLSPILKEEVPK